MARKPAEIKRQPGSKQFTVLLPAETFRRLEDLAGNRSIGEEIRRRLEASFEAEKALTGSKTQELVDAISSFTKEIVGDYGDWSKDRFAFELVQACVNMLLTHYEPKGGPVAKPKPEGVGELLYGPDHSIEYITRIIVGAWIHDRVKRASGDEEKRE
jgi:hypothetical protein